MKAFLLSILAMAVISVGAYAILDVVDFSSEGQASGAAVRLGDAD
ncbi:MAG: hypothetical protein ACFBSD_03800 [Paracoccaceae bacterium]